MNIKDLKNKIWHLPDDTKLIIIPSDDDREESQLQMDYDMWSRTRIKDKGQVLILSFPFGKTELESEFVAVKAERDELKAFVESIADAGFSVTGEDAKYWVGNAQELLKAPKQ